MIVEVFTKRFGVYQPTHALQYCSTQLARGATTIGHYIAKISDVIGLVRQLFDYLHLILGPYFRDFALALFELFCDLTGLIIKPLNGFFDGHPTALPTFYDKSFTILVTFGYLFGGSAACLLALECVGLVSKKDQYRPSTHIRCLANWVYDNVAFVSATYVSICDLCGHLLAVCNRYRTYLEPYVRRIQEASESLGSSANQLISAPGGGLLQGMSDSFGKLSPVAQKVVIGTSFVSTVGLISLISYYLLW